MDDDSFDSDDDTSDDSMSPEEDLVVDTSHTRRLPLLRAHPKRRRSRRSSNRHDRDSHSSSERSRRSSNRHDRDSHSSSETSYITTSDDLDTSSSDEDPPERIHYTEEDLLPMDIPEEIASVSTDHSRFLWVDQHAAVRTFANIQRNFNTFRDCGFIVHDNEIKAHTCVVTAFSQFCNNLFQLVFHRHPKFKCISLVLECDYEVLKLIMDCMYSGAINVRREKRGEFLRILRNLQAQNICEIANGIRTNVDTLSGDVPQMPADIFGRFGFSPISFPFHPPNDVRGNVQIRGRSGSALRVGKNQFICPVVIRTRNSSLLHVEEYVLKQNSLNGYKFIKIRSTVLRKNKYERIIEKRPSTSIIRLD